MRQRLVRLQLGLVLLLLLATAPCWAEPALSEVVHACVLVEQGRQAFEQQRTDEAEQCLTEAARLRPQWYLPYQWLSLVYQKADNKQAALQSYRQVQLASLKSSNSRRTNPAKYTDALLDCEALMAWLINKTRGEAGIQCVLPEPRLAQVARQHSMEMRDLHYFSHESPVSGRRTSVDRFENLFGFRPRLIAENVARRWGTGDFLTPEKMRKTHHGFLQKTGHRRNLLLASVERLGVGIAVDDEGNYWVTELLARYEDK
ncbi:MAG: CAP domain-containing protein [Armatimonadetes bacterium]|nr:CAP domain-containing protein [Armatimonadota bacterium]